MSLPPGSAVSTTRERIMPVFERRMHLRYGVNEAHGWRAFALGARREDIWAHLRAVDTRLIGLSVFDASGPDPVRDWRSFAACVDAVLRVGAVPMITVARLYPHPHDRVRMRWFAERCGDLAWHCVEQWGRDVVSEWYWSIGSNANSEWVNPGLSFELYREIYIRVAEAMMRWLPPAPDDATPRIGGAGVDTFQPFWFDWIWRLVHEIDAHLLGLTTWHQYGEWRVRGDWGAATDEANYRRVLMRRTVEYGDRAETIARVVGSRGIPSACSRVNAHAHHDPLVSSRFNRMVFGAAYYVSAICHLVRAGAHAELFWLGTDPRGCYGLWDEEANETPVFHAKRLCARYVRPGDVVGFPARPLRADVDLMFARGDDGRRSMIIVNRSEQVLRERMAGVIDANDAYETVVTIDGVSPPQGRIARWRGEVRIDGYGVALVTTEDAER